MDKFFDRLGDLLQSLMGGESNRGYDLRDPDMRAAIEELDAYLSSAEPGAGQFRRQGYENRSRRPEPPDDELKRDYATLQVGFGAPLSEVRKSYKRLLHKYHPDRFSGDAEKQTLANEVTRRLNEAFRRIERRYKSNDGMPK